jgi:hypothetical protein
MRNKERNERNTFDKTARTGVGKNSGRKNTGERKSKVSFLVFLFYPINSAIL